MQLGTPLANSCPANKHKLSVEEKVISPKREEAPGVSPASKDEGRVAKPAALSQVPFDAGF
jgi:hypothetical protein